MEGTLDGSDSWFRNPAAQASAHFGVGKDGRIYQWVDTRDKAWHCAAGNANWIGIEHEGHSGDTLTAAQLAATARIVAWAHKTHGVPLQATDSTGGRGIGWHGMGGAAWGGHYDCPGNPIKNQRAAIIAAAKGGSVPDEEDDDMSERISVSASKKITIPADGAWHNLTFDTVSQDSGGARPAKGDLPGIINHKGWATLTMDGVIESTEPLARAAQVRFARKDMKKDDVARGWTWREIIGTEGGTPIGHTRAGMYIGDNEHVYAQVKNLGTKPLVISGANVQGTWKKA